MKNKLLWIGIAITLFCLAVVAQTSDLGTQWTYKGDNGAATGPNSGAITILITRNRTGYEVVGDMSRHGRSCKMSGKYVPANSQLTAICIENPGGYRTEITGKLRRDKDEIELRIGDPTGEVWVAKRFTGTKTNSKDISGKYEPKVRFSGSGTWTVPWSTGDCTLTVNETASSLVCKGTDADYGHKPTKYTGTAADCTVKSNVMTCKSWRFEYKDAAKDISGSGTAELSYGGDKLTITTTVSEKAKENWHPPYRGNNDYTLWAAKGISLTLKPD